MTQVGNFKTKISDYTLHHIIELRTHTLELYFCPNLLLQTLCIADLHLIGLYKSKQATELHNGSTIYLMTHIYNRQYMSESF